MNAVLSQPSHISNAIANYQKKAMESHHNDFKLSTSHLTWIEIVREKSYLLYQCLSLC